jgi:hypothetical protein
MFVVVQVRQTLQQAGASGAYSAARLVIGAALTVNRVNMLSVYEANRPLTRGLDARDLGAPNPARQPSG